jgi:hypothetical protein
MQPKSVILRLSHSSQTGNVQIDNDFQNFVRNLLITLFESEIAVRN